MSKSSTSTDRRPSPRTDRGLALFDLDHTLIPIDSDVMWAEHLVKLGVVDAAAEAEADPMGDMVKTYPLILILVLKRQPLEKWKP